METINDFNDVLDEVIKYVDRNKEEETKGYTNTYTWLFWAAYMDVFWCEGNNWLKRLRERKELKDRHIAKLCVNIQRNIVKPILHNYYKEEIKIWESEGFITCGPLCQGHFKCCNEEEIEKWKELNKSIQRNYLPPICQGPRVCYTDVELARYQELSVYSPMCTNDYREPYTKEKVKEIMEKYEREKKEDENIDPLLKQLVFTYYGYFTLYDINLNEKYLNLL